MLLPYRCRFGTCWTFIRNAHVQAAAECHYKTLGVAPSASQAEIKKAYYELSKKYHPDRNQGSEESAKIFRRVQAAYEVLGNQNCRMKYDKERVFRVVRRPVSNYSTDNNPDYKDEAERIHYQSKTRAPFRRYSYGKTSFYDFDAWFEGHYGQNNNNNNKFEFGKPRQFTYSYHHRPTNKELDFHSKVKSLIALLFYTTLVLCTLTVHKVKKKN